MKQKTKDNFIYLGVALTIVAVGIFYAFYSERKTGKIQQIPESILWAILATPGLVGFLFEHFWEYRCQKWLWIISVATALINLSIGLIAYRYSWEPPAIVWSTMTLLWFMGIIFVANKLASRKRRN
jgi:hypothetical protein